MTSPAPVTAFTYAGYDIDEAAATLRCRYRAGRWSFEETILLGPPEDGPTGPWREAAREAARLVYLLAGVSYYKAFAPPVVDLGKTPVRQDDLDFLRTFYVEGLGEFAYRNGIDLAGLELTGGRALPPPAATPPAATPPPDGAAAGIPAGGGRRPLIPFGGGLDSIVTVELVRAREEDAALFVLSRPGDRFPAIEAPAALTGLPVFRAGRRLDEKVLRSGELGFLNGHVPITGILSAIAVLVAVLRGRDSVVMSNERSASVGNVRLDGREINHQWSKGADFERRFAALVERSLGGRVRYFSELRQRSELWIAERFAGHRRYHGVFRSCNRAFALDPARRLDRWCGSCDKCCFVDLVLAPFLPVAVLRTIFGGREPLDNPELADRFRTLVGATGDPKPWECVGDLDECRAAVQLAARRPDRAGNRMLAALASEIGAGTPTRSAGA